MSSAPFLPKPLIGLGLSLACMGGMAAVAETARNESTTVQSATAQSSLGKQDAMNKALQLMPPGAVMKRYECRDVSQPMVNKRHQCTIFWDPPAKNPQP